MFSNEHQTHSPMVDASTSGPPTLCSAHSIVVFVYCRGRSCCALNRAAGTGRQHARMGTAMSETLSRTRDETPPDDRDTPGEGAVIWVTGLSSAGKTTLARALIKRLLDRGVTPVLLDGNEV